MEPKIGKTTVSGGSPKTAGVKNSNFCGFWFEGQFNCSCSKFFLAVDWQGSFLNLKKRIPYNSCYEGIWYLTQV